MALPLSLPQQRELYFSLLANPDVGTPHSLNETAKDSPSHAAAAKGNIVSAAIFATDAFVLSPLGKLVIIDPRLRVYVSDDTIAAIKDKACETRKEAQEVKARVFAQLGITKLRKGVKCDGGCGKTTRNEDKYDGHYCFRGKACKAAAKEFYLSHGEGDQDEPVAPVKKPAKKPAAKAKKAVIADSPPASPAAAPKKKAPAKKAVAAAATVPVTDMSDEDLAVEADRILAERAARSLAKSLDFSADPAADEPDVMDDDEDDANAPIAVEAPKSKRAATGAGKGGKSRK